MDRLLRATINSWRGLCDIGRHEPAFRQELMVFVVAIPLSLVIAEEAWKRLVLIGVVMLVLVVALLNPSIEKLADRVSPDHDAQIGRVKDMGSAAVGLSLLLACIGWLLALAERLWV